MKRFLCVFLAALLLTCSTFAYAEGKLTVTKKNLLEFDADDTGYFYAKIENAGDSSVAVGYGKLVGFSASDEILLSENYVHTYPSRVVLQPGEYVYAREFLWESALEGDNVVDYKFSIETEDSGYAATQIPCEVTFDLKGSDSFDNYVNVTFTNTGDSILYGYYISVALYDDNEDLIFVDGNSYDALGVHPGSTVTVKLYVDKDLMTYYNAHSINPTKADAVISVFDED